MEGQFGAQIAPQSTQSSYWWNLAPPPLTSHSSWPTIQDNGPKKSKEKEKSQRENHELIVSISKDQPLQCFLRQHTPTRLQEVPPWHLVAGARKIICKVCTKVFRTSASLYSRCVVLKDRMTEIKQDHCHLKQFKCTNCTKDTPKDAAHATVRTKDPAYCEDT